MRKRRSPLLCCLALPLLPILVFLLHIINTQRAPSYRALRHPVEKHDVSADTKFILFEQLRGAGFNNQLQETLLLSYVASRAGRAYVYQDVVWRPRGYDLVPLPAFSDSLTRPPAVSADDFRAICKAWGEEIVEVGVGPVEDRDLVQTTVRALEGQAARCLFLRGRIMNWAFLESPSALAMYPAMVKHAMSFSWSSAVKTAYYHAEQHLGLGPTTPYVAIHLRRGDFIYHCHELAASKKAFNLWAALPDLPDALPASAFHNETAHLSRCWPSYSQIVDKILSSTSTYERQTGERVRTIYVLHDAKWDAPWVLLLLRMLEFRLLRRRFDRFVHTSMLPLSFEEKDLGVAVDMEIARRASVFVGNGFSSLTSNVVLLRLADGKPLNTNRLW